MEKWPEEKDDGTKREAWLSLLGSDPRAALLASDEPFARFVTLTAVLSTYAYVNPLVAVFLGWLVADEPVHSRTLSAAVVIVIGVALILVERRKP